MVDVQQQDAILEAGRARVALFDALERALRDVNRKNAESIDAASVLAADAIAGGGFAHLFGTGHSTLVCQDAFPRIGGYVGWRPIIELALSEFSLIHGENGLLQNTFLEKAEGYGRVILESQALAEPDVLVAVSNSGINPVVVDVALGAQERGVRVVAVTSVAHSSSTPSRHSSGKRLLDIADVVIDTTLPAGDAAVEIPGWAHPVGALSTTVGAAIIQSLVAETAARLADRGVAPQQIYSHNRADGEEGSSHSSMEIAVKEHACRLARRVLIEETR
jgi:uncharacterized phosphosugar-binding protein